MGHATFQKIIILGSINFISLTNGFLLGHMAGMIRALKKRDEGIDLNDRDIYVIVSSIFLLSIFGLGLAAVVSDKIGRKYSFLVFSGVMTLNWIVLYYAWEMQTFMVSRVLAGIAAGGLLTLKICTTSEYSSPKTRALFLNMISTLIPSVGTGIAHVLSIIIHWRQVALIGMVLSIIGIILPYFWVESPHWLASKGHFEECEDAFRKIHGNNSESELHLLLRVEKVKYSKANENHSLKSYKKIIYAMKKSYFWDLILFSVIAYAFLVAAGKVTLNSLSIVIIEEITGSSDILFYTLVVDILIIIGAAMSCILVTKFSVRFLLFTTSGVAIAVLLSLSLTSYFKSENLLIQWMKIILFGLYFFIIKSGPYPVLEALIGEIYPLEVKVYCFFISGTILMCGLSLSVMLLQPMVNAMGYHGVFLLNSAIMSLCLGYIWVKLPKTKGKTLQEIEIYYKTKNFENVDQAMTDEQIKSFI